MNIRLQCIFIGTLVLCAAVDAKQVSGSPKSKPRQTAKKEQLEPVKYGDATLNGFDKIKIVTGKYATAEGADTSITMIQLADEKNPLTLTTIHSPKMTAFLDPKNPKIVARAEADGGFTLNSSRPHKPNGTTTFFCKGTSLKWFKSEEYIDLNGPLSYKMQSHDSNGKLIESAVGTAANARYDTAKQVLILYDASFTYDGANGESTKVESAARITINRGVEPMEYEIERGKSGGPLTIRPAKPEVRKP